MIPWELTITKGQNGYKLSWKEEIDGGAYHAREEYIQEDESAEESEADAKAAHDLLYKVIEHFSLYGSKHNKYRIAVNIEHGSNYNCKGCVTCKNELVNGQ